MAEEKEIIEIPKKYITWTVLGILGLAVLYVLDMAGIFTVKFGGSWVI